MLHSFSLRHIVGLALVTGLLWSLACGPSAEAPKATPTPTAKPTPTVVVPAVQEMPTAAPQTSGVAKVEARPADFMPAPDLSQMAASQVLRVRVTEDPQPGQMDPALQTSPAAQFIPHHTSGRLMRIKFGATEVVPDVATGWEIAEGGKRVTFTLRQGIQWQQGFGELTAQDVVDHFNRVAGNMPEYRTLWKGNFAQVESMEAVDKYTVRFNFKKPDAGFFRNVLVHRPGALTKLEAFKQLGDKYQNIVPGVGPFILSKWEKGVKLELVKNPDYFIKGMPRLDKVEQIIIRDDTVAELAIKTGQLEVDRQMVNTEVLDRFFKAPGDLKLFEMKGTAANIIYLNRRKPPLDNLKLRQALYYAVNWDSWLKDVLDNRGIKTFGMIAAANLYFDEKCIKQYDYNPTLAKQLLAEAGFPEGKGLRPLTFVVSAGGRNPTYGDFLIKYWKEAGIPIDLAQIEGALAQERRNKGDYDLYIVGIGAHVFEPTYQVTRYFHTANFPPGNNNSYFSGADDLIETLSTSFDTEVRRKTVCSLLKLLSEDVAVIGTPQVHSYGIASPKVEYLQTYDENVGGGYYVYETYIKK